MRADEPHPEGRSLSSVRPRLALPSGGGGGTLDWLRGEMTEWLKVLAC